MSGSEHWVYQGRQQHGWFGHGTAPAEEADAKGLFDPQNAADRVDYAAASLIGQVPRGERTRWAASVSDLVGEAGTSAKLHELPGDQEAASELFHRLTKGGNVTIPPGFLGDKNCASKWQFI